MTIKDKLILMAEIKATNDKRVKDFLRETRRADSNAEKWIK